MLAKLVQQYHFKIFFSNKYLHATILDKLTNRGVVSFATNNSRLLEALGQFNSKNDERACQLVGQLMAEEARKKKVTQLFWDGEVSQKTTQRDHRRKAELVWQALAGSGLPLARKHKPAPGESPFLPQHLEFVAGDEGYASNSARAPQVALVKDESEADHQKHRQPLPKQARGNMNLPPQFRQQLWKLTSKRAQMRKATRRVTQPP